MMLPHEYCVSLNFFERQHALQPKSGIGEQHLGRLAFLALLESRLALPVIDEQLRQETLLALLKANLTEQDAAYQSFMVSPHAVSQQLLTWFNTLTLAGWQGEPFEDKSLSRFAIIVKLYPLIAKTYATWSEAARIKRIITAIDTEQTGIKRLTLAQPMSLYPNCWQALFQALSKTLVLVDAEPLKTYTDTKKSGTFYRIKTGGVLASCHAASQLWDYYKPSRTLVVTELAELFDQVFDSYQLPVVGFSSESANRLAIQIVSLACRLFDGQYQFETLHAFLVHPLCPIEFSLAQQLARDLASNKGFTENWQLIMAELPGEQQAWFQQLSQQTNHNKEKLLQLVKAVQTKCAKRFAMSKNQPDKALYGNLTAKLIAILEKIVVLPVSSTLEISRLLEDSQLIQQSNSVQSGAVAPQYRIEGISEPGTLFYPPQLTLWCGPYIQKNNLLPDWHKTEWQSLKQNYSVFSPEALLQLQHYDWQQFLAITTQQPEQTLVMFEYSAENTTHPLFDEILQQYKPQTLEWSQLLHGAVTENLPVPVCPAEVEHKPLPANKGLLELGHAIPLTTDMSASRFEKLIFKPSDFVLNYIAKLRKQRLEQVEVDNMLKGNVAHKIFEAFFNAYPNSSQWLTANAQLEGWLNQHFEQIAQQYALPLLEAGQHLEQLRLQQTIQPALQALINYFSANDVIKVQPELSLAGKTLNIAKRDFTLLGSIDFVLTNKQDEVFILDAKWSNSGDKKSKELKEDRAVQLYFYAAAYHQAFTTWPKVGFFIIESTHLVCDNFSASYFAKSDVQIIETSQTTGQSWQVFEQLANWRFEQFSQGKLELNDPRFVSHDKPDSDAAKDVLASFQKSQKANTERDPYSDYRYLIGWASEGAQ